MSTRTSWRTRAHAIIDEEGEAARLDIDALAALPFVARDYVDGQADPLYSSGIVVHWPGGHDHAMAVADAIDTAERAMAVAPDATECVNPYECDHERCTYWRDAHIMREALPSVTALVTFVDQIADALADEGDDEDYSLDELADALPSALAAEYGDYYWRAAVGRGLSKGPRVTVTFDI